VPTRVYRANQTISIESIFFIRSFVFRVLQQAPHDRPRPSSESQYAGSDLYFPRGCNQLSKWPEEGGGVRTNVYNQQPNKTSAQHNITCFSSNYKNSQNYQLKTFCLKYIVKKKNNFKRYLDIWINHVTSLDRM